MPKQLERQPSITLISILCLAAMILAACQPVTATFEPDTPTAVMETPTSTATRIWFPSTATPTVYVPPEETPSPDENAGYGELVLEDDFSDRSAWLTGAYPGGNAAYGADSLNLAVAVPNGSLTSYRKDTYFSDLYWEITMAANLCTPSDIYGLIFWSVNEQNYHELAFNCSGEFSIDKMNSGYRSQLLDWTASSQVPRGGLSPFRVGLWVGKGLVRIYLNDQFQTGVYIPAGTGGIGIFARSTGGPAISVSYSDMQIYAVSPQDYPATPTPTLKPTNKPYPTQPKQ